MLFITFIHLLSVLWSYSSPVFIKALCLYLLREENTLIERCFFQIIHHLYSSPLCLLILFIIFIHQNNAFVLTWRGNYIDWATFFRLFILFITFIHLLCVLCSYSSPVLIKTMRLYLPGEEITLLGVCLIFIHLLHLIHHS